MEWFKLRGGPLFFSNKIWRWRPSQVSGVFPSVSKHKMLPYLMGKEDADCLMVHSLQCGQRGQGLSLVSKEDKVETVRLWCIDSSLASLFVCLASMEIDTLIIILSETKIGNRSHNNRCVHCHGCDLLCDVGLKIQTGSRSKGIMILTRGAVRGINTSLTLMLSNTVTTIMMLSLLILNTSSLIVVKICFFLTVASFPFTY